MISIIRDTISFVKNTLAGAEGGHDWYHTERVWNTARYIRNREESGDLLTIEQAAQALSISTSTADNDWAYAKTWLRMEMSK